MARYPSTSEAIDDVDEFKDAIWRRTKYRLETDEETPLGGLNPYHKHFNNSGTKFFRMILDHLHIKKSDRILEVGCGTGRIAFPFIKHLGKNYSGFDNNSHFIEHCHTVDGNFQHLDVFHEDWNQSGGIDPNIVEFPYRDRQFHVVFSVAVFNHFRLQWFEHYLSEMTRVLMKGGKLFFTLIIANEPKEKSLPFQFLHRTETEWFDYNDYQLYNIAFSEKHVRRALIKQGLMLVEPIKYGGWNKSPLAITGHDVIIANKRK